MIATVAFALLAATPCELTWPLWNRYAETFISGDGRVIDRTAGDRTTSEGQAYALFFSLIANDRALFQRLLIWTEQNLAQGDLARNLPAWHWGKRKNGSWGVIDANSASDADLWLAYDLLEAGRLWSQPRYSALGERLLSNVAARELANVPHFGTVLVPGAAGFNLEGGLRLNPSYSPPQILRRFARLGAPWSAVLHSSMEMLRLFVLGRHDARARSGARSDRDGPAAQAARDGRAARADRCAHARGPWLGAARLLRRAPAPCASRCACSSGSAPGRGPAAWPVRRSPRLLRPEPRPVRAGLHRVALSLRR